MNRGMTQPPHGRVVEPDQLERLTSLADAALEAIVVHRDGMVVEANEAFLTLSGYTRDELAGFDLRAMLHPADARRVEGRFGSVETVTGQVRAYRRDGTELEVEVVGRPVLYRDECCRVLVIRDISERLLAERALRESERVLRETLENVPLIAVMKDLDGRILFCNRHLSDVTGWTRTELIGAIWDDLLAPKLGSAGRRKVRHPDVLRPQVETPILKRDGEERLISWNRTLLRDEAGRLVGTTCIGEDVTERRRAESELAARARQQAAVATLGMAALRVDLGRLSDQAMRLVEETLNVDVVGLLRTVPGSDSLLLECGVGWRPGVVGKRLVPGGPGTMAGAMLRDQQPLIVSDVARDPRLSDDSEMRLLGVASMISVPIQGRGRPHGIVTVQSLAARRFTPDDANFVLAVANVLGAAVERQAALDRVAHLAYHDSITGLPNREALRQRVDEVLELAARHDRAAAMLWIEVSNFSLVNDSFGEAAGDDVLRQIAGRLSNLSGAHMIGRHGGDEFLVVVGDASDDPGSSSCSNRDDVAQIAQMLNGRILHLFQQPFDAGGEEVVLHPCVGISVCPAHGRDRDSLLRHADVAKNQAKAALRGDRPADRKALDALHEVWLSSRLHKALERQEFELHYQPVMDLETGTPVAVEALVRWQSPERGLIPPNDFIPLAERIGVIGPLTDWVANEACRQAREWHDAGLMLRVGFNVPAVLWQPAMAERLIRAVQRHGVDASMVTVEVTESTAMIDPTVSDQVLEVLSRHGLRLAIDDFGTGHSSLARLRQLPATMLKVDRSFVMELGDDPAAEAMVATIIGLARNLGLEPVAEGIETEQQRQILVALGCRLGQALQPSCPRGAPAGCVSRFSGS
jgi:diguanylate cyclase (GGDEF)-like protein/PAS domain S-box-containing protein